MTSPPLPALGVTLPQFSTDPGGALRAVEHAHRLGFAGVFVFDHLWPFGGDRAAPILECWTLVGALAARCGTLPPTENAPDASRAARDPDAPGPLRLGTLVTRAGLREPPLLAHMAATATKAAGQPLIVGVGGGDLLTLEEHRAFGLPWNDARARVAAVEATVRALRTPRAGTGPPPEVWIGGAGVRMRALAGQTADGWNLWASTPSELAAGRAEVRRAAAAAGRDPASVAATWGGQVLVGATSTDASHRAGRWAAGRSPEESARTLTGDADTVLSGLAELRAAGAAWCVLSPVGGDRTGTLERLARAANLRPRPAAGAGRRRPSHPD